MGLVTFESRHGKAVKTAHHSITPVEESFQMQLPGLRSFFFWRKPASVIIHYPDEREETIEIPDLTRQAQIGILGMTLFATFTLWLITVIRARNLKEE